MGDSSLQLVPPALPPAFVEQSQTMMQQLATAQIQSRFIMAARFPRDIEVVRQNMLKECCRPAFCVPDDSKNGSSIAIYRVPRGGTNIEGVTIRFAEMALRCYKNLHIDVIPLGEDDDQKLLQVVCIDYETNNTISEIVSVSKSIERTYVKDTDTVLSSRMNSRNKTVYVIRGTDEDLAMKRNALISKARRNLIMQCVPGWLVEECIAKVRATARAKDAEDPDAAKRKLYDAFATIGVSAEEITKYLGHSNALNPAELQELRDYYAGIREGYTTWREIVAAKDDDSEDAQAAEKKLADLYTKLELTPAQIRNYKAKFAGQGAKLLTYLEEQLAKRQNDGSKKPETATTAPEPATQPETRPEPRKAATPPPAPAMSEW